MQNIDTDLVAKAWQRAVQLTKTYLQNELAKAQQPTIEGVHADLARCFMRHNDGAKLISQSPYMVALDVSKTKMWTDDQAGPLTPGELPKIFDKILTKIGVMCFFAEDTKGMRYFLWLHAGVSDTELQFICDTWVERQWSSLGEWVRSFDNEYGSPKEAPWLLQMIANLNPLTAVAKIIAAFQGKYLFTGKAITNDQIVEVCIEGVFSVFEMSGCFSPAIENQLKRIFGEDELFRALGIKAFEQFLTRGVVDTTKIWAPGR